MKRMQLATMPSGTKVESEVRHYNAACQRAAKALAEGKADEIIIGDTLYVGRNPEYQTLHETGKPPRIFKTAKGVPFVKIGKRIV